MRRTSIFSSEFLRGLRPGLPVAALSVALILLSAELLLRSGWIRAELSTSAGPVRIPESIREPVLQGYRPQVMVPSETCGNLSKPNYRGTFSGTTFRTELRLNNYGFHDTDWTERRERPEYRVAVLGMSLTAANHVHVENTWVNLIERTLNEDGRDLPVNVMNFGVDGHFLANTRAVLENVALKFEPDLVVLHVAARSVESANLVKGIEYRGYGIRYIRDEDLPAMKRQVDGELTSLQHIPIVHSALARLFCHFRGRQPIVRSNTFRDISAKESREYDRRPFFVDIRRICEEAGVGFALLLNGKHADRLPLNWLREAGFEYALDSDYIDIDDRRYYFHKNQHFDEVGCRAYADALTPVFRNWIAGHPPRSGDAPAAPAS